MSVLHSVVSKQVSNASDRETQPSAHLGRKKCLRACLLSGVPGELKSLESLALSVPGGEVARKGSSSEQYRSAGAQQCFHHLGNLHLFSLS